MGLPNCKANRITEMELGRDSNEREGMGVTVQYWQRTVNVDEEQSESSATNAIRGNMNVGIRTEELK